MSTRSKYINGALCFFDSANPQRIFEAIGINVRKYINEFMFMPVDDTTGDPDGWTMTIVEAGTGDSTTTIKDAQGGKLRINAAANEDDGVSMQSKGEVFKFTSGDPIFFSTKILVDEATQSDVVIGLCITDTTLAAGMTDGVYFRKVDGSTSLYFVTEKDSTETTTAVQTMAAATEYALDFYYDGASTVCAYVDGTLKATHTTNICDDEELCISIEYLNGAAQSNKGLEVGYLNAIQIMD